MVHFGSMAKKGAALFVSAAALVAFACDVDERTLELGTATTSDMPQGGSAGEFSEGGGAGTFDCMSTRSNGCSSGGATAKHAGSITNSATQDGCDDRDNNSVADASETLVQNPDFATNSNDWTPEYGVGVVWSTDDACGATGSGSLSMTYTRAGSVDVEATDAGAATQCLPAVPNRNYTLSSSVLVKSAGSHGALGLRFFDKAHCDGEAIEDHASGLQATTGEWLPISIAAVAPPNARSIMVRLLAGRDIDTSSRVSASIAVDSILLRELN